MLAFIQDELKAMAKNGADAGKVIAYLGEVKILFFGLEVNQELENQKQDMVN